MAQQRMGRIQWGDLTFGPGSQYHVTAVNGLDDLPEIRAEDLNRPDQNGDYTGPDTTGARVIQLGLGLVGDSPDELRALTLALRAATQPQRQPAPLQFLDQDVLVYGKVRQRNLPYEAEYLWSTGSAALELYCADPYLYSLEEHAASTTAYSPAAGRTYPLVYAPASVTNLALNPSTEINGENQTYGTGVTRARTTAQAKYGSNSVSHTLTAPGMSGTLWSITPMTWGTIQLGIWVMVPAGVTSGLLIWSSGTTTLGTVPVIAASAGTWVQVTGAYTLAPGQVCDRVGVAFTATTGAVWYADGVMTERGTTLHDYGDGSMTSDGWSWTGTANASPSVRAAPAVNRSYGDAGASGRLTATNNGASPAFPVLRIDGPVADPSIEQVTTGGSITIDGTLQPGEYLVIDTRTRAVLLMGSSPRRQWVRAGSTWPLLIPGTNTLAYRGSALAGAPGQSSLLTVTWRDTSL